MRTALAILVIFNVTVLGCCESSHSVGMRHIVARLPRYPEDVTMNLSIPAKGSVSGWYNVDIVVQTPGVRIDVRKTDVDGGPKTVTVVLPADDREWARLVAAVEALARVEHRRADIYDRPSEVGIGPVLQLSYILEGKAIMRSVSYLEAATDWISQAIVEETLVAANADLAMAIIASVVAAQHEKKKTWHGAHLEYERAVRLFLLWRRRRDTRMWFGQYNKLEPCFSRIEPRPYVSVETEEEHRACARVLRERWEDFVTKDIELRFDRASIIVSLRETIRFGARLPQQVPRETVERLLDHEFATRGREKWEGRGDAPVIGGE